MDREWLRGVRDIGAAAGLAVLAAAATRLPAGETARLVLTLPILLFVPGFLLLRAALRQASGWDVVVSLGLSPIVVGLFALVAAATPIGFRPDAIIVAVTVGCLVLAAVAVGRRWPRPVEA